jgi:hypothetical protein
MSEAESIADLRERVARMEVQISNMEKTIDSMSKKIDTMADVITSANGGKKVVIALITAAASMGGVATWFVTHFKWTP